MVGYIIPSCASRNSIELNNYVCTHLREALLASLED